MLSENLLKGAQEYMSRDPLLTAGGWLIYDYRNSNPVFWQVLQSLGSGRACVGMVTRPCLLFVPAVGAPVLAVHHVDAGKFQSTGIALAVYRSRATLLEAIQKIVPASGTVAMEYSPMGTIPRASRVDAGTVELVRSLGVQVVSSADLLQYATLRLSETQLSSHRRAAGKLDHIVQEAFEYVGSRLAEGPTEHQVAEFIRQRFDDEGLQSPDGPIVAVNEHASDPHYEPDREGSSAVKHGDLLLIDLWATEPGEDGVYADITWVAYVGAEVPERYQEVFQVVIGARDSALRYLEECARQGISPEGRQVDTVAREYIASRGYGDYFTHRLGHSIGNEMHGDAVNLDSFETEDTRRIIPGICFSVEPGIYLPEFGVRSEIDVFMSEDGPFPTTSVQREIVLIKG